MKIKLFENWLVEETDTATGSVGHWYKPVEAEVAKVVKDSKQNVIQVKSGGRAHLFAITGVMATGTKYDINFQKLEKTADGGLKLWRYVKNGTEPYEVDYSDISTLLPKLARGENHMIDGWIGDVYFKKLS